MEDNRSFLGRGWSFPPTFNKSAGTVEMTTDLEDINSSLAILLSTSLGERVMQPEYGCDLSVFLFESMDNGKLAYLKDLVKTAIILYEPRIDAEKVNLDTDNLLEGRIEINVTYKVRATNSRFNYVFPYYIKEGTNI
ncbi:MAG: GPW/gp25 family protein [Bacteroidota bacterium]